MNTLSQKDVRNILVVSANWIGDCIFSAPVFAALKEYFPQARIVCMGVARVREVLESIPFIDEVMVYDEEGAHRSFWAKWKFARSLGSRKFDLAFLLRPSYSRALLLAAAAIPVRIGYAKKGKGRFLTRIVSEQEGLLHRSDHYLRILEEAGIPVNRRQCVLRVGENESERVKVLLREKGIEPKENFIVLNPGGNWDLKRWPLERYIKLAQALLQQNRKVVLTGAEKDTGLAGRIHQEAQHEHLIDLSGKTSLKELMALLQKAKLVVSGDSGPLHMASSVGTPVVALFGPTRAEVTAPRGKGKSRLLQKEIGCNLLPCYFLDCPNNQCMQAITLEDVLHEIKRTEG